MKKRIDWIDIVRAMGMFLIIMGHTLEGYTYSIVGKLIFAVHVPVFFVLSGYLYKEKPVKKVFKSRECQSIIAIFSHFAHCSYYYEI